MRTCCSSTDRRSAGTTGESTGANIPMLLGEIESFPNVSGRGRKVDVGKQLITLRWSCMMSRLFIDSKIRFALTKWLWHAALRYTPITRVCRICKSKVNQDHHYCQECAFSKGEWRPVLSVKVNLFAVGSVGRVLFAPMWNVRGMVV